MQALLLQFEGVIYASLKKLAIHKGKQDYDDFYQLGCLKLFDAYHDFDKDPFDESNRYPFVYYASQRLHWAFLDEMRKLNRVLLFGRFSDGSGGLVIYEAETREEVEAWVKEDPYITLGARDYSIHEWDMQTDHEFVRKS